MKMTQKLIAIAFALAFTAILFVGCTSEKTTTPEEPTPTPTVEATPEPTPTPKPSVNPEDLYSWVYNEYEPGKIDVSIYIDPTLDDDTVKLITEVIVPSEIDGKTVTKIPYDFFGCRSRYGARRGFMDVTKWGLDGEGNKIPTEWDDVSSKCNVHRIVFPDTIEIVENDMFGFQIGDAVCEFVFEGTSNLVDIWGYAFAYTPAEVLYCRNNGGSMVLNGILTAIDGNGLENYVCPENVTKIVSRLCHRLSYRDLEYFIDDCVDMGIAIPDEIENDFSDLTTFVVNDGCVEIGRGIFENAPYVEWIYIPASVTTIGDYLTDEDNKEYLTIKAPEGSYAIQWAIDHGYNYEYAASAPQA